MQKVRAGEIIKNPKQHSAGYVKWVEMSIQKQIDKLTTKLQIHNVNNGTINNFQTINNTLNIKLLNHVDTDYSHLTHVDYISCFRDCNYCVKIYFILLKK